MWFIRTGILCRKWVFPVDFTGGTTVLSRNQICSNGPGWILLLYNRTMLLVLWCQVLSAISKEAIPNHIICLPNVVSAYVIMSFQSCPSSIQKPKATAMSAKIPRIVIFRYLLLYVSTYTNHDSLDIILSINQTENNWS